jgi:tetratricopeptide (TPR) repeat protein
MYEMRGLTLWKMKRMPEAYRALQRSIELHEKQNTPMSLRYFALQSIGSLERETRRLDAAVEHLEKAVALRPLEEDPQSFAEAAMELAMALEAKGRAFRPRACTLVQQSVTGFSAPRGGSPRREVGVARRWLEAHHCQPPQHQ